ncbi:NAD(P)/FAD-dependent oxidoreductase [Paraburkholderia hospita]|uniref:NAD(P)/FAD-dependent oxidoreductase n=1 Tax=Paraburkholderia hospita TaxID=169430 RepID=UPI0009A89196|nr:FAD-dependent oxidoreductase [Paraburkholderia hospita]SKD04310.1 3-phenylpropionate/trans-cinnamate dioxygenase ferredoxin reductase subunit [Paraburkholderia hospita]
MSALSDIVIIGAGQAGLQIAATLRQRGFEGAIRLLGDEKSLPYQRPPLSKAFLKGTVDEEGVLLRPAAFFETNKIDFVPETSVQTIDIAQKHVVTSSGQRIQFDKAAIATGTRCRTLNMPGVELAGVHTLRSIVDAKRLQTEIANANSIVIVGGGFIGLEVAGCAVAMGKKVTVLESAPRLMGRAIAPGTSQFFLQYHSSLGIRVVTHAQLERFVGDKQVSHIQLADGTNISCDLVLVGVGALANDEIARAAGLECSNGIAVNELCMTSSPDIVAAGDCTIHPNTYANGLFRLESVQNAIDQAKVAAGTLLGDTTAYNAVPWFWSDQADVKLQTTGLPIGANGHVVRGDMDAKKFSVFHLRDGVLIAVDSINAPAEHMTARKLVTARVTPRPESLADSSFDLKSLLAV